MKKLPAFLKKYFWDVDFTKINADKSKVYVLKRILEYGDSRAVQWMWKNFKKKDVKNTLCESRGFSQKTANFWAFLLNIPREKVICLKRPSSKKHQKIWPY